MVTPTPSYSTFTPPAQYQFAEPNAQLQQAHKPSAISRRSFIGGSITGLAIAGAVGAGAVGTWLYLQRPTSGQTTTATVGDSLTIGNSPNIGASSATPLFTYAGHQSLVHAISWSPDGAYIVSGSQDGECQVWTADKGKLIFSIHSTIQPPISDDFVQSLVWSRHNPPRVAVGFIDGTLQILDINNRQRIGSLTQGYTTNGALSWSPDEKYLAVCKNITDHAVVIYDVATWNIVSTYQDHTDSVKVVAWSPDGTYVASGSDDTTIRVWEPLSGKTHIIYKEHSGDIAAISWSSDSSKIVSSAQDYIVRVWQPERGNTLLTHQYKPQAPMGKVSWSHNNKLVAAYPGTGSMDILDAQLTIKQTIQVGVTYDFSWSPDDTRIATANYNNSAQIWHVGA
jgi:WD40 repeat protein